MSIVIGVKYRDGVALASDKQVSGGGNKANNATKLQRFKYSNSAMGVVGSLRDCNIIRTIEEILSYKDILDKTPIDELYVIKNVVPTVQAVLQHNKRTTIGEGVETMDSEMLYCTKDNIYSIGDDFAVLEADTYYQAIGSGQDKAAGFLASIGDTSSKTKEEITDIINETIKKGCESDLYVNEKVDIIYLGK